MNDARGALWRKWDLHVHTPASIVQYYGPDTDATWEKYFSGIESLDSSIKVLGINDYLFVDGYKRILTAKSNGRMPNIEAFFPVIELRLEKFGGSKTHLSRANLHVLFSDEVNPDIIQQQFLNALPKEYILTPKYSNIKKEWNALATRSSLEELGQKIIDSVPERERASFSSPLVEGFNNLSFSFKGVLEALNSHYFKDKVFLAVGKTEWADIKWNDHTIADKKDIINRVDAVFTSAESPEHCQTTKAKLRSEGVNSKLLDCSDAHYFADSSEKDRLGKCFTWIKADTTFRGLRHAIYEYGQRVYLGVEPPKEELVRKNRTKYITSLSIHKNTDSKLKENWFDNDLEFNNDLIAIIGSKGSGKSALTDTIALLANTKRDQFSFLSRTKFREPQTNKASHFTATLEWKNGSKVTRSLADNPPANEVEKITYIPQNFFEAICNEIIARKQGQFEY